jgi:diguanylate cyclase (GGDEF)-like protein/PAS domain S-box-containing protein
VSLADYAAKPCNAAGSRMPNNGSILLIQDEGSGAQTVRAALSSATTAWVTVIPVKTCDEALQWIARDAVGEAVIAAILVDLKLSGSRGLDVFERVIEAAPLIPILILCDAEHEDLAKKAVQSGAQDYLLKEKLDDYLLPKALTNMIGRASNAEALFIEKERAEVTLNSIGDAVLCCDNAGCVTYLNLVAEKLTGWNRTEAAGRPVDEVFCILDGSTREPAVNPMAAAISENRTVLLAPNSILTRRDGVEASIEDSAAPIHDRRGRVTGAVMVFHDVSSTRALSLRISHQAQHDSLTDLPNRALLHDRLNQGMALARRHSTKLAVMFLDVDRFKNVNDSLGHDIGDQLLILVAQRLRSCVRTTDTVSRQGGDEFVILLTDLNRGQDAAIRAERMLASLAAPYVIRGHTVHASASIGIVIFPDDSVDAETLLKNADFAMYHAKDCGRSNYQFFREEMNVRALERQAVENGLRVAVERDELVLHYQPIFDLWSGAASGMEALLRWQHPTRGLLLPGQFMAIAEESAFIVPMGRWTLAEACRQSKVWESSGIPPMRIAVNVSPVELRDKDFIMHVRRILTETAVDPNQVEFELTETFLMQDSSSTAVVLRALKELGVRIALDDFGTGYSSLSHLKGFPIDTLKIDRGFVNEITTNDGDASIIRAVITLGNSLHIRVIAEGVETAEQLARLQDFGCPEGQGYLFSRGVPADEIEAVLRSVTEEMRVAADEPNGEVPAIHMAAKRMKGSNLPLSRRFIRN